MAKSIIERIFLGTGYCDSVKLGKEYDKISRKVDEMYLKLTERLSEEQIQTFTEYSDLRSEECAEAERVFFEEGVKLGILLCIESMS